MNGKRIGIVLPTYNEENNIPGLLRTICEKVPEAVVLVVDDSPNNLTAEAARNAAAELRQQGVQTDVRVLKRTDARGRMSAVRAGFEVLNKENCDYLIEMDTDGSHPPSQLPQLISTGLERETDILICSRDVPGSKIDGWPFARHLLHFVATRSCRLLLRVGINDYMNAYRMYSRRAVNVMLHDAGKISIGFWGFGETLMHIIARRGNVSEIPTHFINRTHGQSQVKLRVIVRCMIELLQVVALKSRMKSNLSFVSDGAQQHKSRD